MKFVARTDILATTEDGDEDDSSSDYGKEDVEEVEEEEDEGGDEKRRCRVALLTMKTVAMKKTLVQMIRTL